MSDILKYARFRYRRIAEGVIFVASLIVLFYSAGFSGIGGDLILQFLPITETVVIGAGIALSIALVSLFWVPKKNPFLPSLIAYTSLWCSIAALVFDTGGLDSPFVVLWVAVAVFSGVFGAYGFLPVALAPVVYLCWKFITGDFVVSDMAEAAFISAVPLVLSYITWMMASSAVDSSNRTYQQLASELSQVSGKAEVVINAITDGVVALNSQGNIQLINPAAQQMIGWGKHDALMLNYKSVLKFNDAKGNDLTAGNDPVVQALASNKEIKSDSFALITNSGKKILISLVISPVGQPGSGVIIVFRDITNEKAEERQQAEFISTASHEMRTPVASIEGYLGLALNPATAQIDVKARDYITKAHESAQHLGRLFSDLLDVSKAEDGRLSNNPKVVDLVAFTENVVQGLRQKAEDKGLTLIFKPNPDADESELTNRRLNPVFYVNVDNDHLREIISNLVDNAIKYTPKGTVAVDITGDAEHAVVSIEDSGIGIPAEDQPHLFQKFYRVDNTDTREIGGTGLGLYLCRRLAEAMDGRIWVESQYKQGSKFFVELPRTSHEEAMQLIEVVDSKDKNVPEVTTPKNPAQPAVQAVMPGRQIPVTTEDAAYVNTPADEVANTLTALPVYDSKPTEDGETRQQSTVNLQQGTGRENPSLAAIEQNPSQYLRRRAAVNVPQRDQNQP